MPHVGKHTLIGLDVDATRVRAVTGAADGLPQLLPLDPPHAELPLALSLEGRSPHVGRDGIALCRRLPHLACLDFLAHLGEEREWTAGRHRLDAARALALVFEHVRPSCAAAQGVALAVPAYLGPGQVALVLELAQQARLWALGAVPAPLATALTAYADQPWTGPAAVVEADDRALTWAVVHVVDDEMRLLDAHFLPHLGLRAWKDRLLDLAADRCVRQSRRDPRDSASAEQSLYEQLDSALDACLQGQPAELAIQTPQWYQHLILRPEELATWCAPLVRQALDGLHSILAATLLDGPQSVVLVSAQAGRLPGLMAALEAYAGTSAPAYDPLTLPSPPSGRGQGEGDDFGEALVDSDSVRQAILLSPDAAARAAQGLAARWLRGELPAGVLAAAPLLPPQPPDLGPPRLHFRGQDYLIRDLCFSLGRHGDCHLVFDSDLYPAVSARHCDIVYDHRTFTLRDRSRNGTLVNERPVIQQVVLHPGDWIRLGPLGPLLRFLGRAVDQKKLMTIA